MSDVTLVLTRTEYLVMLRAIEFLLERLLDPNEPPLFKEPERFFEQLKLLNDKLPLL